MEPKTTDTLETEPSQYVRLTHHIRAYSLLTILSVIWGVAFVAIRIADSVLTPVNLALLRWFIAAAGYIVILPFLGKMKTKFELKDMPRLLIISFANVPLYHLSLNYGETSVSAGLAGLLVSVGPILIVLLSRASLKEKIGRKLSISLIVATSGAVILSIQQITGPSGSLLGIFEILLTALAYALFAVLAKPLIGKYGALPIAIRAGALGTLMLLPLLSESFVFQVTKLSVAGWLSILYLSLLSTVLGYSFFYTLLSRGAVSKLSIQLYLIPIVSLISGFLILGEQITIYTFIGGAFLLSAIALVTRPETRKTVS
jgi:drug/metabolite transporter (DMT)-like permease